MKDLFRTKFPPKQTFHYHPWYLSILDFLLFCYMLLMHLQQIVGVQDFTSSFSQSFRICKASLKYSLANLSITQSLADFTEIVLKDSSNKSLVYYERKATSQNSLLRFHNYIRLFYVGNYFFYILFRISTMAFSYIRSIG